MNIVGVTSCIAGLAHTPMAAKMLEKEGKRLGHQVKIEQQGAMGIMDRISAQDIAEADFVLIAADRTGVQAVTTATARSPNLPRCKMPA